jgi:PAS domain S-box-containing protein
MKLRPQASKPVVTRIADLDPPSTQPIEHLQIVLQLTEAVGRAAGLDEIYEAALDGLHRSLGAQRASILLYDPDGVMRFKAWRGLSDGYRGAVEGHSSWTREAVAPEPILVPDVLADPGLAPYREVIAGEGIRALGFIPLVSRDALIGKFMVYFDEPHTFQADEVQLARAIAGQVAFAVDRRRSEDRLALYREIFANSSEAIAIVDEKGEYLEQNAAHRALTGYDDHELQGRTPAIHLGSERFAEIAAELAAHGLYKADVASTTKSGDRREIELSAFSVRDDAGRLVCHVGIKRDISARKHAERALRFLAEASAALDRSLDYDTIVRQLADLVVPGLADWTLVDVVEDGRLVTAGARHDESERDQALAALVAKRGREAFPLAREVFESGDSKLVPNPAALLSTHFADDADLAQILSDLSVRSAIAVALKAHDRVLGVLTLVSTRRAYDDHDLAVAEDLASRAAAAIDNARLYREAQESDRRKEEFLAVLAHELRNPLAPIVNSAEIIRVAQDPATLQRSQVILERQARNMKRLVDDLLDVSRITRGKIGLKKQSVELGAIVDHAVETARPLIDEHEVYLTTRVEPGIRLEADPLRLEQVLTNLLSNAARHTPSGGEVVITARREAGDAVLSVRDSGGGISPDLLPRVFDLFVQGRAPEHGQAGGLGIGLTLARGLVELHGGTMHVASEGVGKGSEFTVRLPLAAAEAATVPPPRPAMVAPPKYRVVVVDDNEDAASGLAELLRIKGHEVAVAHSGAAGIEMAADFHPDVVLLDIGLPDLDGHEVAERIRASTGNEALRIIAISGYAPEHFKRGEATAFTRHLVKPVDWAKLESLLAE